MAPPIVTGAAADLLAGESGWLVGFLIGMAAGIMLTRWLWINGQMAKRRLRNEKTDMK